MGATMSCYACCAFRPKQDADNDSAKRGLAIRARQDAEISRANRASVLVAHKCETPIGKPHTPQPPTARRGPRSQRFGPCGKLPHARTVRRLHASVRATFEAKARVEKELSGLVEKRHMFSLALEKISTEGERAAATTQEVQSCRDVIAKLRRLVEIKVVEIRIAQQERADLTVQFGAMKAKVANIIRQETLDDTERHRQEMELQEELDAAEGLEDEMTAAQARLDAARAALEKAERDLCSPV